jgi:uncharacterized protein (DUF433 family)
MQDSGMRVMVIGGSGNFGARMRCTAFCGVPAGHRRRIPLVNEADLLKRITVNPKIFGGKPIVRGRRLAVEHVLGMLAAGDSVDDLLRAYPWLEREDVLACLAYARRIVGHERVEPAITDEAA